MDVVDPLDRERLIASDDRQNCRLAGRSGQGRHDRHGHVHHTGVLPGGLGKLEDPRPEPVPAVSVAENPR
jgi:hypothetical protein